jgi:hypothetical protein
LQLATGADRIGGVLDQLAQRDSRVVAVQLLATELLDERSYFRDLDMGIDGAPTSSGDQSAQAFRRVHADHAAHGQPVEPHVGQQSIDFSQPSIDVRQGLEAEPPCAALRGTERVARGELDSAVLDLRRQQALLKRPVVGGDASRPAQCAQEHGRTAGVKVQRVGDAQQAGEP